MSSKLRKAASGAGAAKPKPVEAAGPHLAGVSANNHLFGLSSDFPALMELDVAKVHRDPEQPRKVFNPAKMESLAESIREKGLKQPILVRPHPELVGEYMIVFGERRWRAHGMASKSTIFAIFHPNPHNIAEIQLIENDQRDDLTPFERGRGYRRLMEEHGYSQRELAKVVGKSQPEINRLLGLLALPDFIVAEYEDDPELSDTVSKSMLAEIAAEPDPDLQVRLWESAKSGATVKILRQLREVDGESGYEGSDPTSDHRQAQVGPARAGDPARIFASFTRSAFKVAKHVEQLRAAGTALDDEARNRLLEVRSRIDALLGDGRGGNDET